MNEVAVIVQARLGSKRFPEKILADLNGKPVLWHVLTRARQIEASSYLLATPNGEAGRLSGIAADCGFTAIERDVHEDDVLGRYYETAVWAGSPDYIVRITADCPLIDPEQCNSLLRLALCTRAPYVALRWPIKSVPSGMDCEVFTFDALEEAHFNASDPYEREHPTQYMLRSAMRLDHTKLSIDTTEDLQRVKSYMAQLQ